MINAIAKLATTTATNAVSTNVISTNSTSTNAISNGTISTNLKTNGAAISKNYSNCPKLILTSLLPNKAA